MKKPLLLSILLLLFNLSNAQIIFEETFDGISGSTAGGAGTYSFPNGWFLRNVDNRTPDASVAYVNEAWERREDFANNFADSCAFSTSWYTPTGAANDWMWTPAIGPLPSGAVLSWNALAYDPQFIDGYEVRIMTSGPPTGGTGTIGNQVTNSTVLFTTSAENTTWTSRTAGLSAYAGQTVYIGFRNNSNDKFLLLIDDIKVEVSIDFDAAIDSVTSLLEYTIIPDHQQPVFTFSSDVTNHGTSPVTGVELSADVYNGVGNNVHNSSSTALPTLAPAASANLTTTGTFNPTVQDAYNIYYSVAINEADGNSANDTLLYNTFYLSDTIMARDDGTIVAALGIGAGNGGYLGNQFEITETSILSSASVYLTQSANTTVGIAIYDFATGVPANLLYASPLLVLPTDTSALLTFEVSPGAPLILNPGTYLIAAVETDSTLQIGTTNSIFTPGTCWVNWPTTPFGGWANVEEFGAGFAKTFVIRANLQNICSGFNVAVNDTLTTICSGDTVILTAAGGDTYIWNTGDSGNSLQVNPTVNTDYIVTGTNAFGCVDSALASILVNPLPNVAISAPQLSASECEGNIDTLQATGATAFSWSTGGSGTSEIITHILGTTSWTVSGTDSNGCIASASISINAVNALPNVTANASDDSLCIGDQVTLTGGGAASYNWNNGVTDGIAFSPSVTQNYLVTGTDINGCVNTDTVTVVVISCIGLDDLIVNEVLTVYPNPSSGLFQMQVKKEVQITVYSIDGKYIQNMRLNPGSQLLNLENEASGVYILYISTTDGQYRMKLTKE